MLAAYREVDLFALPCRIARDGDRDGLPNVVVEAQSQRLCVLSTAISGVPELIEDDVNGVLIQPDDAEALARELARLITHPDLRRRLGAAGEKRVREAFDHATSIADLVGLFSSVDVTPDRKEAA